MPVHAALSPSRVKDFRRCPLLFRLRVIDKVPEQPSLEALRGTLVHAVLEHLFDLDPSERTPEGALALLGPQWDRLLEASPEFEELFASDGAREAWLDSARELVRNYFAMENPRFLQPAAREAFVNATLPTGIAIRGIIDRVDQAPDGALRIVDYKTGKSPHARFQEDALFQMKFYATALQLTRGVLAKRTQLVFLKDGRTLTYDPQPEDVDSMIHSLTEVWHEIEDSLDREHFPARASRLCDWCAFQALCPEFGGSTPLMSHEGAEHLRTAVRHRPDGA